MRIFLCLLLLCAAPAHALDAITPDGGRYFGPLKDGKLHGKGRLEWANGARYEGEFANGLMSGKGRLHYGTGDVYEGELRDGLLSGKGRFQRRDGEVYEGDFDKEDFHGQGRIVYPDGSSYRGGFDRGDYHGKGRFESAGKEVYEGDFAKGEFTGKGTYTRPDGSRYSGEFRNWRLHGAGRYVDAKGEVYEGRFENGELNGEGRYTGKDGRRYEGGFKHWRFDGQGVLRRADGSEQRGVWRNGWLDNPKERRQMLASVETALHQQRGLLDRELGALAPSAPGRISMYLLAVAGDGSQEVFRREVQFVREQFDRDFGTRGRSVALINSRSTTGTAPMATVTSIREALGAIAARMDRERDILFLFLTSHGSREHELSLQQNGMALRGLPAAELGEMLKKSGIRWKAVLVSACYSGGFIEPLKDDTTLVITAARHDRQSFGCSDENDFTYFGRAFFKDALPASRSFRDAFGKAEALVAKREPAGAERSLPQMHSPAAIEEHLKRWWAQARTSR